ncbi:MAG: PilZ domain-containing protein [Pseudomonadota bacterium]
MEEQRAFPRAKTRIRARLLVNQETPGDGAAVDLSAGGVAIESDLEVQMGDRVVLHFDGGTRLVGDVRRIFDGGFALELALSESKRDRLIQSLQPAIDSGRQIERLAVDRRITQRVKASRVESTFITEAGDEAPCRIVDVSLTGAAIESETELHVGAVISLGRTRGVVMRRDGNLYGVMFDQAVGSVSEAASLVSDSGEGHLVTVEAIKSEAS